MKILQILSFVSLLFVMLGCHSQISKESKSESKTSPTAASSSNSGDSLTSSTADSDIVPELTIDKFNQIKTGMTYDEVKNILGREATREGYRQSRNQIETYYWEGVNYRLISVVFMRGKVSKKVNANLY